MNIVVIREKLKEGLDIISRATGEGSQLPILKNILLEASKNKITLVATNLEIATTCSVMGKIIEDGKTTVPGNLFSGLIGALQSERINISLKNESLEIKSDNYKAKIQGTSTEEFPIIPRLKEKKEFIEMDQAVLKEALSQTVVAAQFSEIRPELNNIHLYFTVDSLVFAATDSFRLGEKKISDKEFKSNIENEFSCLLPLKTANELLRILNETGAVKIFKDENQILFETEQWECISRLGEGRFPEYKQIIPKTFISEAVVERSEFMNAVKLTSVLSSRVNEISLKPHDKAIEIVSGDESAGENDYLLAAKISGKMKPIGFNWKYLSDGLKALKGNEVYLGMSDENKAVLIKTPNEPSYFYILMPILKG
ncbi:MAG: DNA polymerase III subunit beta [Parcubacteria group bacterium LiPW_15]|nr:MAG: DNA polymerase III subunit beta [Parcubacteria group bacterium LiPW_15]